MMNSKKKIYWSIIMPAYNVESYIEIAIKSVINQTIPNEFYELVIIDDSSSDKTIDIARFYKSKYDNIKLIESKNGPRWQSICWNEGLNNAKGIWLGFLDADDYLYPNALEEMTKYYIKNKNAICAWSQNERWDYNLKNLYKIGFSEDPYKYGSLIDGMLTNPGVIASHFLTCNRESIENIGGFDTTIKASADRWLVLKMDLIGTLGFLNKVLHKYRFLRPGSVTLTRRREQIYYLSNVLNSALKERNDSRKVNLFIKPDDFNYELIIKNNFKKI